MAWSLFDLCLTHQYRFYLESWDNHSLIPDSARSDRGECWRLAKFPEEETSLPSPGIQVVGDNIASWIRLSKITVSFFILPVSSGRSGNLYMIWLRDVVAPTLIFSMIIYSIYISLKSPHNRSEAYNNTCYSERIYSLETESSYPPPATMRVDTQGKCTYSCYQVTTYYTGEKI